MKIKFRQPRVFTFLLTLLLLCGVANQAWAYKVTYHILTLPIDNSIYHMDGSGNVINGKRLEAIRVVVNNATTVGLPDEYKSPLAKNFTYYLDNETNIEKNAAVAMYSYAGDKNKSRYYDIKAGASPIDTKTYEVPSDINVYVTYQYDDSKGVDLSGATEYNLTMSGGFLAFNRGRNNRVAVFKKDLNLVKAEHLVNEDFSQFEYTNDNKIAGTNISTFWKDNKTPKATVAGQFHFIFKLEGSDPYNIIIGTAYNKDYAYLEKHGTETSFYYKWYKGSHLFRPSSDGTGFFMSSDDHKKYTKSGTTYDPNVTALTTEAASGYYKSKGSSDLTYGTFALLNSTSASGGYVFMVSRFINGSGDIDDPKDNKYNFLIRDGNYNNLTYSSMTLSDASKNYSTDPKIYRVQNYVFKVRKKISGTELSEPVQVSEYYASSSPLDFVPDALKRKYVTFTGAYKQYEGDNLVTKFNTFAEVDANATTETIGGIVHKVIWLDYETTMPFDTWTKENGSDVNRNDAVDFDELKWYNFYVNKNESNSAYWDGDGTKIKTSTGLSKYARASHFAFVGDPYDLTIVGRKASEDGSGNPSTLNYMKLDATIGNNTAFNTPGTTWGIMYDDDTGDYKDCFRLKDNSGEKYLHRNTATDNPLNGTDNSDEAVRITVDNLPTKPYVYYIRDLGGNIAVKASGNHEPSAKLGYNTIPEIIRSPFIEGRTLTFYGSYTEAGGGAGHAKTDATDGTPTVTYAKDTEDGAVQHIVVKYDFPSEENPYYPYLNGSIPFNVRLNGEYIYYDSGTNTIMSKASPTDGELGTNPYLWIEGGADPYAMTIKNVQASKYVTASATDKSALGWDADVADATKFVIKSGTSPGVYEVMYGTGETVDASTTYYNIGRDGTGTKMFQKSTYEHGYDQLRFQLTAQGAHQVTYHLIDKQGKDLLQVVARHSTTDDPLFPNDYRSPLVAQYHYYTIDKFTDPNTSTTPVSGNASARYNLTTDTELAKVDSETDIYVTYTANNLVDMSGRTLYLMKFAQGDQFRQEDGSDGLLSDPSTFVGTADEKKYRYQAVYPYCNGDCNFNVYGQEQYDIQQQGAASTRTRWAWYVESINNDPYHVKIFSRQQETYPKDSGHDYNAYFHTYAETYGGSQHVVTTLAWPGISGVQGTEYMVLGSAGQFRLMTTDEINDGSTTVHRVVNSFEQYWKTWNTIRKKILEPAAEAKQSDPNTVPATPASYRGELTGTGDGQYGWHSYEQWAYAIRWNGFNKDGEKNKKGWENIEHWYQTINMGGGYFDFVKTTIDPVLILLDQHGWEVMRKPLPSSPDDREKDAKYDAIRPYDSPMVKEYHFWTKTSKRYNFHQYYKLEQRVEVDGKPYTSTSLTDLPPFDATHVHDTKGNLLDQYVTYTVKDEYLKACNVVRTKGESATDPEDKTKSYDKVNVTITGVPFLIQQGTHFVYNNSDAIGKYDLSTTTGGMSQYIIENVSKLTIDGEKESELWYLMPNKDIDYEMGYQDTEKFSDGYVHAWASDYDRYDKVQESGFNSWAFDPYNIQISSVAHPSSYFVTDATEAHINDGSILGNGLTNTLDEQKTVDVALVGGMDNRTILMTNATFMAVRDAAGNMQLMPRFDHEKRLKDFSTLTTASNDNETHTKLYRPLVYDYRIIDNSGKESLRYQSGGDLVPQTPDWFKSPLAKDFEYYKNLTLDAGVYTEVRDEDDISAKKITESLEGAAPTDNTVYVRYSYNAEADELSILQGKWLTMQLNNYNMFYDTGTDGYGIYDDTSSSKPEIINAAAKKWQWKFLESPFSEPDPYAVPLYNRNKTDGVAIVGVGAILSHSSGNYALIKARTGNITYQFLKSNGDTSKANMWDDESSFKSASCTFDGTKSQIKLINDVIHTFNYKIYTNNGDFAVSANQNDVSEDNSPVLPDEIRSPLLNKDQFRYYEALADTAANSGKQIKNLYGLYDDIVYVRYNGYNLKATEYKVPNVKTVVDNKVARGEDSNDAALDIKGELIYNIIWYDDNMMQSSDNATITGPYAHEPLKGGDAYVWQFEGNDPYAIKIKHKHSGKYVVGTNTMETVAADASPSKTFMLLPSTDSSWEYGMLQVTGGTNKLSGYGQTTTADDPTKFIIFGLSTHKVIYHLVIANINSSENIPYYDTSTSSLVESYAIAGSTMRDLNTTYQLGSTIIIGGSGVNYCVDEGHITLGDPLKVPEALKRPNCKYFYYVGGIYDNEACTTTTESTDLNTKYKGHEITQMGTEPALLGKTVVINVVYAFDDGLPTNNGANFVTNTTGTQWFTTETNDETPYLARITYEGTIQSAEGREPHYTNEFLWKPVGDPYGFKMYNRYTYKNDGQTSYVMTTTATPADGQSLTLGSDTEPKTIYELFAGETDGYFIMRPMLNNNVAIYNNAGTMSLSSTNATEWTFGLNETLFKPYRDRAGYVGGLDDDGKTAYDAAAGNLQTLQGIVYNDENIVSFASGYYRLHNLPNSDGITTPRYMSGYLHEIEKTYNGGNPMHFYSRKGVNNNTFESLESGYTVSPATQGQIPIPATEYDPSSIFYITGLAGEAQMHTQGLNVIGNKMGIDDGTSFHIVDIGGACVVIYDGSNNYLSYNGTNKYDIGYDAMTASVAERSKWCLEPANNMGLYIKTNSGGEEETLTNLWYYSSYCVPFDLLVANKNDDEAHSSNAYTCVATESPWPATAEDARVGLHPKPIGKYNTGTYKDNDYFVPAGTPVLFSTKRATEYIKATIPTTTPSSSISTIFSSEYLEQVLTPWVNTRRVYVFGPKMEGTLSINTSDGTVNATLPSLGNTNVGFHLNANPNKEAGLTIASWTRNNYYVLHNRIYYREPAAAPSPAPAKNRAPEFVPVIFDDEEEQKEMNPNGTMEMVGDGCIYDLMGRKVATREQVEDGSWWNQATPGVYILNGRKVIKK